MKKVRHSVDWWCIIAKVHLDMIDFVCLILGNFSYNSTAVINTSIVTDCSWEFDGFSSSSGSSRGCSSSFLSSSINSSSSCSINGSSSSGIARSCKTGIWSIVDSSGAVIVPGVVFREWYTCPILLLMVGAICVGHASFSFCPHCCLSYFLLSRLFCICCILLHQWAKYTSTCCIQFSYSSSIGPSKRLWQRRTWVSAAKLLTKYQVYAIQYEYLVQTWTRQRELWSYSNDHQFGIIKTQVGRHTILSYWWLLPL